MEGYNEIERFSNKKVKISIVENISTKTKNILKLYPNHAILELEMDWFQKLRGNTNCRVPKVVKAIDRELLLENVGADTLLKDITEGAMFKINMLAGALARYLKSFHEVSGGYVLDEINLNGYIFRGGLLNGFDFVTARIGEESELASETIAEILCNTNLPDIRKQMFIREFLRVFGGTVLQYKQQILNTMEKKISEQGIHDVTVEELFKIVGKC